MRFDDIQKKREEEISKVDLGIGHLVKERVQELLRRINATEPYKIIKVMVDRNGTDIISHTTAGNEYWETMLRSAEINNDEFPDTRYSSPDMDELFEILEWKYIEKPDFDWSEVQA